MDILEGPWRNFLFKAHGCHSISALERRQLRIITQSLAAECHGVYMQTWQAGLKWKAVVHWGKLWLLLSSALPVFNLKMWYSLDKALWQEWAFIMGSNSRHSWVGIDYACSSSSMQALPSLVTTAKVNAGVWWKCFHCGLTRRWLSAV